MHAYSVFGLGLHSEFPIPELMADDSASADVVVTRGEARPEWLAENPDPDLDDPNMVWAERRAELNETVCGFGQVGRYWVRAGQRIVVEPHPGVEDAILRHALLGAVLAHLLWQRDVFTLHASVLGLDGHHVAFVGVSGEGKSTTAAALEARGHTLVCDDVAALEERADGLWVLPAFPRMRLYGDSLRGVGDDPAAHPHVHSLIDKRSKQAERFAREPVRLERVFVLDSGDQLALEPLSPGDAVMAIVRNTFLARQYAPLYGFKQHLERAARVAGKVPLVRLRRPKDLAQLPELVSFIEAHAAG